MSVIGAQFAALSDGAATGLIIAIGAGGSFAVVLALTVLTIRRSEREAARDRHPAAVGGSAGGVRPGRVRTGGRSRRGRSSVLGADSGQDPYPPQPYSPQEPRSHRPYSRPYKIPRQDSGTHHANGSRPPGSTGVPTTPWPPADGED